MQRCWVSPCWNDAPVVTIPVLHSPVHARLGLKAFNMAPMERSSGQCCSGLQCIQMGTTTTKPKQAAHLYSTSSSSTMLVASRLLTRSGRAFSIGPFRMTKSLPSSWRLCFKALTAPSNPECQDAELCSIFSFLRGQNIAPMQCCVLHGGKGISGASACRKLQCRHLVCFETGKNTFSGNVAHLPCRPLDVLKRCKSCLGSKQKTGMTFAEVACSSPG